MVTLDFTKCKTKEDVEKVFAKSKLKEQLEVIHSETQSPSEIASNEVAY